MMELDSRIHYDAAELTQHMEALLDRLRPFEYDSKYGELLGREFVEKLSGWEQNVRRRKNDPFTLVVCGDFKRGKSSLINALLGEDVAPTNVTTETMTINRISYGPHKNEAVLSGGRRLTLLDEDLEHEALKKLIRQLGEPIEQIVLQRNLDILRDVTVVDTPGLGDATYDFTNEVEKALQQADAVIYVFSTSYPLSRSEQLYLKSVILPQRYTSLFLVSNFADMIESETDYGRMQEMLSSRVSGFLPGQEIWMLSALGERCRQMGKSQPNELLEEVLNGNFQSFRQAVDALVQSRKETVVPDRMQRMLRMMVADLRDDLSALEQGLEMSSQDVQHAMDNVKEQKARQAGIQDENCQKIDKITETMQCEANDWIFTVLGRMKDETAALESYSAEDLSRYYPFYCVDTIQEAMTRCVDHHMARLYEELEDISGELARSMSKDRTRPKYNFRFVLDNKTWTKGDNVGFAVSMVSGGLLSLIADGVGGAMRKKEITDAKPKIIQAIVRQYDSLFTSVQNAVAQTYKKMGEQAKRLLTEFYAGKLETLESQIQQSAAVARQDEARKEQIREAIGQLHTALLDLDEIS